MARILRSFGNIILVVGLITNAHAANVLLLGDDGSETEVQQALENAGHTVISGGLYWEWDGSNPRLDTLGAMIYLDGVDYTKTLGESAAVAVNDFVARGCGLILTEWTAYNYDNEQAVIKDLIPVFSPSGDYGESDTWAVQDTGHPLTQGVPNSWADSVAGWSSVTAKTGTVVLITGTDDNPLLSYSTANGGTVVHINHDLAYSEEPINPNALQLIVNAANYASCSDSPPPTATAVPTLSQWAMIIMSLMLTGAGIRTIRRRMKGEG